MFVNFYNDIHPDGTPDGYFVYSWSPHAYILLCIGAWPSPPFWQQTPLHLNGPKYITGSHIVAPLRSQQTIVVITGHCYKGTSCVVSLTKYLHSTLLDINGTKASIIIILESCAGQIFLFFLVGMTGIIGIIARRLKFDWFSSVELLLLLLLLLLLMLLLLLLLLLLLISDVCSYNIKW